MSSNHMSLLHEKEMLEIAELAKKQKAELEIGTGIPVANDMFFFLEKKNIILVQYPFERELSNDFASIYVSIKENDHIFKFIGLNTNDYYDKQLFAIAHELYHYAMNTEPHISRQTNLEKKSDVFAAEFLLPRDSFRYDIIKEFGSHDISGANFSAILRFIAKTHCTWGLPYKSIVKRLYETRSINATKYDELYSIDERNKNGEYYKIGISTDEDAFIKLNKITGKMGTDMRNLEVMAKNYEDDIIGEETFVKGLKLFSKKIEDFGLFCQIEAEDEKELETFFSKGKQDES